MLACKTFIVKHRFCVLQLYMTLKESLKSFWKTSFSLGLLDLSQAPTTGFQLSPDELIYTCKNDKCINRIYKVLIYNAYRTQQRMFCNNHAIPGNSCWRSIVNVMGLKDDLAGRRHGKPVTIGQRQSFVIIQHWIKIFYPDTVHRPIQH